MRTFIKGAKFEAPGVFARLFTFLIAFLLYILTKSIAWTLVVAVVSALVLNCVCFRRWFRRTLAIVIVLILAVMIGFNHYNEYMKDVPKDPPTIQTIPDNPDNKEKEEDLNVEQQDVIQTPYSGGAGRGGATKTKPTVTPTFGNTEKSEFKVTTGTDPNTSNPNNTFGGSDVDFDKKNKEEGYEQVATGEDGVTAWNIPDDEDGDKNENENSNLKPSFSEEEASGAEDVPATTIPTPTPSKEDEKSAADVSQVMTFDEDVTSNADNAQGTQTDTPKDESKNDKVSEPLDQPMTEEEPKETPKDKENTTVISQPKEEISLVEGNSSDINDIEIGDNEEVVKPQEPVKKAELKITALDGNSAYAGDTVQFKISGDIKSVEGLDGVDYALGNGYLSIQTNPNEATVLTPTLVAEDGTTVSATVTVNVLNFNN